MITDKPPRKQAYKDEYLRSESLRSIPLPPAEPLRKHATHIEVAMEHEDRREIELACNALAQRVCKSFGVAPPKVKVLGVRPLEEIGDEFVDETFGDYDFATAVIRLWMRTAVLEKMTSYGTLLSTLCHEICHDLDVVHFVMPKTYHTVGIYERAGMLYHHARGTPVRTLVWDKQPNGTYRINWPQTMRGGARASQ